MSDDVPVLEALHEITAFLDARGVEWAVVGGLAIRVLALPRPTFDVDLIAAVPTEDVDALARAAADAGFVVDDAFQRGFCDTLAGQRKLHLHARRGARLVRIDLFVLGSDFARSVVDRRQRHDTDAGSLWLASPEDVLLMKLLADRPRDRADVADLLLVVGPLDRTYLGEWALRLDVAERLDRAFAEIE